MKLLLGGETCMVQLSYFLPLFIQYFSITFLKKRRSLLYARRIITLHYLYINSKVHKLAVL